MTTQIEAMKMMVAAMEEGKYNTRTAQAYDDALAAGRAAIEAAEKVEPVGRINEYGNFCDLREPLLPPFEPGTLLYLHPPSAEIEELRRDAARYRFLRQIDADGIHVYNCQSDCSIFGGELDYAIDACMKEKQP